jgi:hypothetical protein
MRTRLRTPTRVFGVVVGVIDRPSGAHGARQPQCGITNGGAQFEDPPGVNQPRQLIKHARAGRAHDGHIVLRSVFLHLAKLGVACRQERIDVLFNLLIRDSTHEGWTSPLAKGLLTGKPHSIVPSVPQNWKGVLGKRGRDFAEDADYRRQPGQGYGPGPVPATGKREIRVFDQDFEVWGV